MEDSEKRQETSGKTEGSDSDPGDIFQPTWFRRLVQISNGVDRILLENRPYLLFHIGILFWFILLHAPKVQK